MSFNSYPHEGFVAAYQISATPFVTSSNLPAGQTQEIYFGSVSRFLTIKNTGGIWTTIAFGFSKNGVNSSSNYFVLSGSESFTAELRTDRIFVRNLSQHHVTTFSAIAGLTAIPSQNFMALTGSNGYPGVG
jgi:hypothetical protein